MIYLSVFSLIIPSPTKLRRDILTLPSVLLQHPCDHSRINILQWILTNLGTYLVLRRVWNLLIFQVKGQCHWVKFLLHKILVNTRINILQWIFTNLGTYLVLRRVWNPNDFQGHRSRSPGQIFRQGATPRFALPLLLVHTHIMKYLKLLLKFLDMMQYF